VSALEYLAPPACPSRSEWLERVRDRLADGSGSAAGWSVERLAAVPARVTLSAAGTEARVVFHDGGLERSLAGADCEEVASAAALILAVALGSSQREAHRATETGADAASRGALARARGVVVAREVATRVPAPRAQAAAAQNSDAPASEAARRRPVLARRRPPSARVARPSAMAPQALAPAQSPPDARIDAPPPSAADHRRWSLALGASAEANAWTGPWPAGVLGVSVGAVSPSRGWSARVAGTVGTSERAVDGRRAEFHYWGGHLDLCPIALGVLDSWRWASCAELHLGLLQAEGDARSSLASGVSQRALLATAAATTRLETPPLWAVRLQLEGGIAVPLVRQTFQFGAPEQVMFESPAVGLFARAGILVPLDGQRD
jgi:hypothetical protein